MRKRKQAYMESHSLHNLNSSVANNQAKVKNDCVSRNGYIIKIAQPNSTILVSFSSMKDALFNDAQIYNTFIAGYWESAVLFLGTPGIDYCHIIWENWGQSKSNHILLSCADLYQIFIFYIHSDPLFYQQNPYST